jgi:uncharacterized iron-regulated membrane protein
LRKFWLNLHLFIALTVGFIFVILGVTGSCNVFYSEFREWQLPMVRSLDHGRPLSLDRILQIVQDRHPQRIGRWILLLPGYGSDYLWVNYLKPEETQNEFFGPLEILVDPYSGKIADQRFRGRSLPGMIYELHADLLLGPVNAELGEVGFETVCWLGLVFFISCLSGLYLWRPRWGKMRQALTVKFPASSQRLCYDLHKVAGVYGAIFLIIIAFSGFSFAHRDKLKPFINFFSFVRDGHLQEPKLKSKPVPGIKPISIVEAVMVADSVFPGAELRMVKTPGGPEGVYMIAKRQAGEANRKRPSSKVWIDQYSGRILALQNPKDFTAGETFLNLLWPLHDGQALGRLGQIVWCVIGFMPLVLYVTGILRWLQKRRAKNKYSIYNY